jgi:hypothetical protein
MKRVALASLGVIVISFGWLFFAMDYSDHVVVGTYVMASSGQTCILTLRTDHSFHQERTQMGSTVTADGVWRRIGEGGLAFSKQFLIMPGQEPGPDGTSYGRIHKALGLFPSISLAQYHVLWYGRTDAAKGTAIVGSYAGDEPQVSTQLTLNTDHSFRQSWSKDGSAKEAAGTWGITKTGDVKFSKEFLKTSGNPLDESETASAWNPKGSNLQIVISVNPSFAEPVFRRKVLGFW